jgi:hypothetical protein
MNLVEFNEKISNIKKYGQKFGRTWFNESFLTESPRNIGLFPAFDVVKDEIEDFISYGSKVISISPTFKKIELTNHCYYCIEQNNEIVLAVQLDKSVYGYIIRMTGKNPKYKNQPPYASDLYIDILRDSKLNIILSDKSLSEEGFKIWSKLFNSSFKITIYNIDHPGKTFKVFNNYEDFKSFFDNSLEMSKYQYVLSENLENFGNALAGFNGRRYRELAGLDLED